MNDYVDAAAYVYANKGRDKDSPIYDMEVTEAVPWACYKSLTDEEAEAHKPYAFCGMNRKQLAMFILIVGASQQ